MRRWLLVLSWPLSLGACDGGSPAIGVVVSVVPKQAVALASSELDPGEPGWFEAVPSTPVSLWTAEEAIAQATSFVNDKRVIAVIGHTNSTLSIAASQIYNAGGLVQIAPTTTSPMYDDAGPWSFRLVPSDAHQAAYLDRVLRHHWPGAKRVAAVHVNDDYGRGLFRELRPYVDTLVFDGLYTALADSSEVATLVARVVEHRPDVVLWLGRSFEMGVALKALRGALPDVTVICSDGCDSAIVYDNPEGRYTGLHFVRFTDPSAPDSALRSFQKRYRKATGEVASSEALLTYDAAMLVHAALRDGARTRDDVRLWLESLGGDRPPFQGLTGRITFDSAGTAMRTYMLAEVREDGVVAAEHRM